MKTRKTDFSVKQKKFRIKFVTKHRGKDSRAWKTHLQAVGDMKDFSYYPKSLQNRFRRFRASWTYMNKAEKKQSKFMRPKRWFPPKEWKKVKKQKIFGLTTSTGKTLAFLVTTPYTSEQWAKDINTKVTPFLKKAFPGKGKFNVLLDGEKLLRGGPAKTALKKNGIVLVPDFPPYSPDLNPQENVWAWAEPELRRREHSDDSFTNFQSNALKAVRAYPSGEKLVGSLAKKCKQVLERSGGPCDK